MTTGKLDAPLLVYFASLADYNAGRLHGRWVDLGQMTSTEDIHREIQSMLDKSEEPFAEEWAIHDYQNFHHLSLSEHLSLERLFIIAERSYEYGAVYLAFLDYHGISEGLQIDFQDEYRGTYKTRGEYVQEMAEISGRQINRESLGWLYHHIDWESAWQHLDSGGAYAIKIDFEKWAIFTPS